MSRAGEKVKAARAAVEADPLLFARACCWGREYQRETGVVFRARLWPGQEQIISSLAAMRGVDTGVLEAGRVAELSERRRAVILKAAKIGCTWATMWFVAWDLYRSRYYQALFQSKRDEEAQDLLRRFRFVYSRMPGWLEFPVVRGKNQKNMRLYRPGAADMCAEVLSFPGLDNTIRAYQPSFIYADEMAYMREPIMAAVDSRLDETDAVFFASSTGCGLANEFADVWQDAVKNGGKDYGCVAIFGPWQWNPSRSKRREGKALIMQQEYPETPEEALVKGGQPYFDPKALDWHAKRAPNEVEEDGYCVMEPPRPGYTYVTAADTSYGLATSDLCVGLVCRHDTGRIEAYLIGRWPPMDFARRLAALHARYPGWLVVERNRSGIAVLDALKNMDPPPAPLYVHEDREFGWPTSAITRPKMMATLSELLVSSALRETPLNLTDTMIHQLRRYRDDKRSGRQADDIVMALAIGARLRQMYPLDSQIDEEESAIRRFDDEGKERVEWDMVQHDLAQERGALEDTMVEDVGVYA